MSTVVPLERDPHAATQELLPWYARGQLDDEEMGEVQAHLQQCPRCRAELEAEQALQSLPLGVMAAASSGGDVEAGLARMRQRIRQGEEGPRATPVAARWFPWALGLQGAAIAVLLAVLVAPRFQEDPAEYQALSAPGAATVNSQALVMFRPDATEAQIRAALQGAGATLAGGPTESGAYLLLLPREGRHEALARLRARPGVSLAESLEPGR